MDSSSDGAHADMLGVRFGVRAAEDGHLPHLSAHAAVAHVATNPMRANATGGCRDRALIKQNLGPTVGE